MKGRLPMLSVGQLPAHTGGMAPAPPRLQAAAAGQVSPWASVKVVLPIGWDMSASIWRWAMTSEVVSRRLFASRPTETGTSCATATIPMSSTTLATRTSISVKPRWVRIRMACCMAGLSINSLSRLAGVGPVASIVRRPNLNGAGRHNDHGAIARGRHGGVLNADDVKNAYGIYGAALIELNSIAGGGVCESRDSEVSPNRGKVRNSAHGHSISARSEQDLILGRLGDAVAVRESGRGLIRPNLRSPGGSCLAAA